VSINFHQDIMIVEGLPANTFSYQMMEAAEKLETVTTFTEAGLILLELISHLLFPFMFTFLLVFLVIFEYVLGAFAEITRFADRQFYSDWWNSTNWLEFSRE